MYTEAVIGNEVAAGDVLRITTSSCLRTGGMDETLRRPYISKKWSIKCTRTCVRRNRLGTIILYAVQCLKSVSKHFQSLPYCVVLVGKDTCRYVISFVSMATAGIEPRTVLIGYYSYLVFSF